MFDGLLATEEPLAFTAIIVNACGTSLFKSSTVIGDAVSVAVPAGEPVAR